MLVGVASIIGITLSAQSAFAPEVDLAELLIASHRQATSSAPVEACQFPK
ncbi:MAG: hypothetical protein ABI321_21930 [Polyangia bacterium]